MFSNTGQPDLLNNKQDSTRSSQREDATLLDPQPPTVNKPRRSTEQRLKDIQDALAGKPVASERHSVSKKENILRHQPLPPIKSRTGREQRLKDIQDALAGKEVTSEMTHTNISIAKRPSCSSPPQPPPTAKRRRLESSREPEERVSPSHTPNPSDTKQTIHSLPQQCPTPPRPTSVPTTIPPTNHPPESPSTVGSIQLKEMSETKKVSSYIELVASRFIVDHWQVQCRAARKLRRRSIETHIDEFFAIDRYTRFPYDPSASVMAEFYRMCNFFGWKKDDEEKKTAREQLSNAMAKQFNSIYGTDVEDINSWKNLCRVLGIFPIPKGLWECRDVSSLSRLLMRFY